MVSPSQLVVSHREYQAIQKAITDSITDDPRFVHLSPVQRPKHQVIKEPKWTADLRAATRVYLGTNYGLQAVQFLLAQLVARRSKGNAAPRKPLIAHTKRFAASISLTLFLHRLLYRFLHLMRRDLLRSSSQPFRLRRPWIWQASTWRLTPAIGASLSGLALGIYPGDQLRITIAIYVFVRTCELLYKGAEAKGYMRKKPRWMGSWMLSALSQGQLLHAFVFDPDCFPTTYGDFILNNSPEYVQPRPTNLSPEVKWPERREQMDSIAQMARLRWPAYVSPILRPKDLTTLPAGINQGISPITDRAHPALQYLSCALIHPHETSCFTPFLRQLLLSFNSIGRFIAIYYSALSLLRISKFVKAPVTSITALALQVLRTTTSIVISIAGSWASICFGNNYLPKSFIPTFRFFIAGTIAGNAAAIDRSSTGHGNNMYALRNSLDCLWKVGIKHKWWRGIEGGDVYLIVLSFMAVNALYDTQRQSFENDRSMAVVRLLRGDIEIGLRNKTENEHEH